jgi:hypothetical protein
LICDRSISLVDGFWQASVNMSFVDIKVLDHCAVPTHPTLPVVIDSPFPEVLWLQLHLEVDQYEGFV